MTDVDVVVVGAGFAGLSAAHRLVEAGRSVAVLEARDRVGGRTLSVETSGAVVDAGGQWVGPTQDRLYGLAEEMGVAVFPQWTDGDPVVVDGGRGMVADESLPWPDEDLAAEAALVAQIDELAASIPTDAPWSAPKAMEWDSTTAAQWIRATADTPGGADIIETVVKNVFATEAANLSLLHFLFYIGAGGGWQSVVGLEDGAQKHRFRGGVQLVAVRLADRLGDVVRLGWPVRRITQDDAGVEVSGDAGTVTAERVIVAIPPTLAGRIAYEPALPPDRDLLTQRMPAGTVIKFHVVYDTPWWRERGLSGIVQSTDADVRITLDGTPEEGSPGVITGFLEGAEAIEARRLPAGERRGRVLDVLVAAFGDRAADPLDFVELDWAAEEWTRGCYGAHLPPGAWTQHGPALREPVGRIHWAGTETATRWMGYIDGAIESGHRAATEADQAME